MSENYDLPGKAYDAFKKITPKATSKQFTQLGKIAQRGPASIVDLIGQEAARQRLASKPQSGFDYYVVFTIRYIRPSSEPCNKNK